MKFIYLLISLLAFPTLITKIKDNALTIGIQLESMSFEGFIEYGGQSVGIADDVTVTLPSGFFMPVFSVRETNTEIDIEENNYVLPGDRSGMNGAEHYFFMKVSRLQSDAENSG